MLLFKLQTPKSLINQTHSSKKNQYCETIKKKKKNPTKNPATTTTPKSTKIKYKQQIPKTHQPTPKSTKSH
jgi:hypothetical protein